MNLTYILGGIAVMAVFIFIVQTRNRAKGVNQILEESKLSKVIIDTTSDSPIGFGYKVMWISVHSTNLDRIVEVVGLKDVQKSNWKSGIESAYGSSIFITPPIDEWTMIVGYGLGEVGENGEDDFVKGLLNNLSDEFGEAQFFGTHRVVDYHHWIRSINGEIVREYGFVGESGESINVMGEASDVESKYNLINTFSEEAKDEGYYEREDLDYPDEEMVMEVAGAWSIDPTKLDSRTDVSGLGVVGDLK